MPKQEWTKLVARNCAPLHTSAPMHEAVTGFSLNGIEWRLDNQLFIIQNTQLGYYFTPATVQKRTRTNIRSFLEQENTTLTDTLDDIESEIEQVLLVNPEDNVGMTAQLLKLFRRCFMFMMFGYDITYTIINEYLEPHIGEDNFQKYQDAIIRPYKRTTLAKEHKALQSARKQYTKRMSTEELDAAARDLAQQFGYIHSEYLGKEWNESEYRVLIQSMQSLQDYSRNNIPPNNKKGLDDYADWLVSAIQRLTYIFEDAKSAVVRANWALRKSLNRLGYDENTILLLTAPEFETWIRTYELPENEVLSERKKYYALIIEQGQLREVSTKKEVEDIISSQGIEEFHQPDTSIKTLQGQSAYPGKVTGRVKIVYTQKDAIRLKKGEILVASMTTPELILGMQNAAAFIIDEGGTLCHAAILAREMQKPCIVGTEIATKVLKDGDVVKVDAEEGVITLFIPHCLNKSVYAPKHTAK